MVLENFSPKQVPILNEKKEEPWKEIEFLVTFVENAGLRVLEGWNNEKFVAKHVVGRLTNLPERIAHIQLCLTPSHKVLILEVFRENEEKARSYDFYQQGQEKVLVEFLVRSERRNK